MDPFCLLESWLIREAGFWILTRRKERDFGGCWNSIYDTDSKVIIGTASAGLGLKANRAIERDEIITAFGESIILRGRAAEEAHELIKNYNTMCTVGRGFQYSIRRKLASETTHTIVIPSADRLLALVQRGISPDLRRALN